MSIFRLDIWTKIKKRTRNLLKKRTDSVGPQEYVCFCVCVTREFGVDESPNRNGMKKVEGREEKKKVNMPKKEVMLKNKCHYILVHKANMQFNTTGESERHQMWEKQKVCPKI